VPGPEGCQLIDAGLELGCVVVFQTFCAIVGVPPHVP